MMRSLYLAIVITCVPLLGIAQEPTAQKPGNATPTLSVSYDNWWVGEREFRFHADGSFTFKVHNSRFHSQLEGKGKLPPERLQELLSTLEEKGFFDISEESIEKQITQAGGRQSKITDQTTYRIAVQESKRKHQIKYYNVHGDAKKLPTATDLQRLKDSIDEIRDFLSRATSIDRE